MAIRTSGKQSDLGLLLVPLAVLVAIGVALADDPAQIFLSAERKLWQVAEGIGSWVAALIS